MEDLKEKIKVLTDMVNEHEAKISNNLISIQLIGKDYEYMKKTLDNIESDSKNQFLMINNKLDDIDRKRLKAYDEMRSHIWKSVVGTIAGVLIGALITFYFKWVKYLKILRGKIIYWY